MERLYVELARELRNAGLIWEPQAGDFCPGDSEGISPAMEIEPGKRPTCIWLAFSRGS